MSESYDNLNVAMRLASGICTTESGPLQQMAQADPTKYVNFMDDFLTYTAASWTVTEVGAGGTQALTTGANGLLLVTTDVLDNDNVNMQLLANAYRFVSGKRTFYKARFKVSDATQTDLVFGLISTNTDVITSVVDGTFFRKDDGDTNIDFVSFKDSAGTTSTALATITSDTYLELGFYFDGTDYYIYKDGTQIGHTIDPVFCDNEDLRITFAIQAGSAGAKNMTVDYIFVAQER